MVEGRNILEPPNSCTFLSINIIVKDYVVNECGKNFASWCRGQ